MPLPQISSTDEQLETLTLWARGRSPAARLIQRARIVLLAADGQFNKDISAELGIMPNAVVRWRERFARGGLSANEKVLLRGGRKPKPPDAAARKIIEATTQSRPPNATNRSCRSLAAALNIDKPIVCRV